MALPIKTRIASFLIILFSIIEIIVGIKVLFWIDEWTFFAGGLNIGAGIFNIFVASGLRKYKIWAYIAAISQSYLIIFKIYEYIPFLSWQTLPLEYCCDIRKIYHFFCITPFIAIMILLLLDNKAFFEKKQDAKSV